VSVDLALKGRLKLTFFRKQQDPKLEDRLRSLSGEPSEDFVRTLTTEVRATRLRTTKRSRRVLAAIVTSGFILIPFTAFGGIGYAAQAAKSAAQSVSGGGSQSSAKTNGQGNGQGGSNTQSNINSNSNSNTPATNTPDEDQYKPGKGCGDKNHEHEREDECKKPPK
jgi:hypothetical protein